MLLQYEGIFELSWVSTSTLIGSCLHGIFEDVKNYTYGSKRDLPVVNVETGGAR
jgi:hypothetical protein